MRNGTVAWTRKILSAEPIQFLIQKPDTIGGKFAKTKNRRAYAFNCEEYHILVSGSESPQNHGHSGDGLDHLPMSFVGKFISTG